MRKGVIILVLFLFGISFISAANHTSGFVNVTVDNAFRNLNSSSNYFFGTHIYASSPFNPGHDANQIWVSVNGGEMTLFNALQNNKLCPKSTSPLTYSYSPADKSKPYHFATEILYSPGKNFQQAINEGKLNSTYFTCNATDNDKYGNDSCGSTKLTKIQECGDSSCGSWGSTYISYSNYHYYQDRTCHDRGCSSGACFDTTRKETRDVTPSTTGSGGDHTTDTTTTSTCPSCAGPTESGPSYPGPTATTDGGGGGGGGGKVICTELYNLGIMSKETYEMDVKYAAEHFSREALNGYQAWAISVVKVMRTNSEVKEKVIPLVNDLMEEIAYRSGKSETGNEIGRLFLDEAIPHFERIGKYIDEPNWRDLFIDKSFLSYITSIFQKESEYDKIVRNYFTEDKVMETLHYAEAKGGDSQIEFAKALIENLEKAANEIETMIKSA